MTDPAFHLDVDADGIALVTWDMPGRSMNILTTEAMAELAALAERLIGDPAVTGVIVTSGKPTFSGGADLAMLQGLVARYTAERDADPRAATERLFEASRSLSLLYRRIETGGKPWVTAIGGLCVGGAFELALATHARLVADDETIRLGLPEMKVGLFPGAGGSQRVMRLADPQAGLTMMLQGRTLTPKQALAMKLVGRIVPRESLIETAKAMLRAGEVDPVAPWDRPKFVAPGGKVYSPQGFQFWPAVNAIYRRETHDNYPAARALLSAVVEGLQLPMDLALKVESRWFTHVMTRGETGRMIRSLFLSMQALKKGARRPAGEPAARLDKIGILGAGVMGAGIAHVAARAGLDVVLVDRDAESAAHGLAHAGKMLAADLAKGRLDAATRDAVIARIHPTADCADLAGADLVIEAVFEDRDVKAAATKAAEAVLAPGTIFATNTSSLPIGSLAAASREARDFIGIHFFSPVEKMMLVEIIRGPETGPRALATALDFVRRLDKTPIVVEDGRGFYTSRVVMTYIREGLLLLAEGVPPAMIEGVARASGMPVGPLALADEVALDLCWHIVEATRRDLGTAYRPGPLDAILAEMVVARRRLGRKNRMGFYDYPEAAKKRLWPGLAEVAGPARDPDTVDRTEIRDRLLGIQALETARIFEEGVLTDLREADVGSILGFGFAPFTGGTIGYIDGETPQAFAARMHHLASKHGERFAPNRQLQELAAAGESYYGRYG